ncbi:hypothetical protein C0Q70_01536 [Pomacea canaliculata]|uniref:Uncharacterized protein n=2 Tax=Pomacea canaliculata TaxID=400727 RepID=A0A2T7PZR7_POMCA|nr:hypothetical protein C0Q70_01536 [Pomacea canaliculata]
MIIKHLYDSNVKISLRGQNTLLSVLASGTVTAVLFGLAVSSTMVVPAMIIVVSCLLSVVSLHLTFMLLSLYDNTTAVVFMLWAQVVDTVVFVSSVSRPDILLIPVGAVLFALGHYYYFKDGVESGTIHLNMKRVGVNEMITRLQFVLYACSIIALLAIVFQPKLSERDINILSYVGLDRIARKLLSLSADHQ